MSRPLQLIERIPGDRGPIVKRTVKDQISDKLAYMIHSGLLLPGDELPSERELATTLGVSRETVRAAIGVLQARKMIEVSQGARTKVLGRGSMPLHESVGILGGLKHRSLDEVAEARAAVEVQVIWLAAQRITPAQLARLQALVDEQRAIAQRPGPVPDLRSGVPPDAVPGLRQRPAGRRGVRLLRVCARVPAPGAGAQERDRAKRRPAPGNRRRAAHGRSRRRGRRRCAATSIRCTARRGR